MRQNCACLVGLILLFGIGTVCLLPATVAANGDVDTAHVEMNATELEEAESIVVERSVEIRFGDHADFGSNDETSELQIKNVEHTGNIELRGADKKEDRFFVFVDSGDLFLIFEEDKDLSGQSIEVNIYIELYEDLKNKEDKYQESSVLKSQSDRSSYDPSIGDVIVDSKGTSGQSVVDLTINPGPPEEIDLSLSDSRTGDHTPVSASVSFTDEYGNQFQKHPVTITLNGSHHHVSKEVRPNKHEWPPTIGINGTVDPIIGNVTVTVAAENCSASEQLQIYPENPALQPVYSDLDADGECEVPIELQLTEPQIGVEPLKVTFEQSAGPGEATIRKQSQDVESTLGNVSTDDINITSPQSTYLVTADTAGEYTIAATAMPAIDAVPTANASLTAHDRIVGGDIQIKTEMIGIGVGNCLQLTIDELRSERGAMEYTQRSISELAFENTTAPVDPITPEMGTYEGSIEIDTDDLTPGTIEAISIKFDDGTGGTVTASTTVELVHERFNIETSGWNRISVPVVPETVIYNGVSTDQSGTPIEVGWCDTNQQYERLKQWSPADRVHRGWYVHTPANATVGVTYTTTNTESQNRSVTTGWNLLGSHFNVSATTSRPITEELAELSDPTVGDKTSDTNLTAWETYWVYVEEADDRHIDHVEYEPTERTVHNQQQATSKAFSTEEENYPAPPSRYTGTISIDGSPVSKGTTVTVETTNGDRSIMTGTDGQFELVVEQGSEMQFESDDTDKESQTAEEPTGTLTIQLESETTTSPSPSPTPSPSPSPHPDPPDESTPPELTPVLDVPESTTVGTNITLCGADSEGKIESYTWTVAGTEQQGKTITTAFDAAGTHEVQLTITDTQDRSEQTSATVTVNEAADLQVEKPDETDDSPVLTGLQLYLMIGATVLVIVAGLVFFAKSRTSQITGI